MTTETTALEKANQHMTKRTGQAGPLQTVRDLLDRAKKQISDALPKHMTPERMIRIAFSAMSRNPELLKCEPVSLVKSVIEASELGLEPSGILGHAYLVPFQNNKTGKKEAQLQIGYRGYCELAYRSGRVRSIAAEVVHEGDVFEFERGTTERLRHVPDVRRTDDKPAVCAYATVHYMDGGMDFEVLTMKDIADAQKASLTGRRNSGPWQTHWEAMAKKTAIRRLAKRLPLSPELVDAAARDEEREVPALASNYAQAIDVVPVDETVDPETGEVTTNEPAAEREPGAEG